MPRPEPSDEPLGRLQQQPADALLAIMGAYRADARTTKIDLGVGVYRDARGDTPVLAAVKQAERLLWDHQPTKAYLAPEGDAVFLRLLISLMFGPDADSSRIGAVQTPGGTGALRTAGELVARARPEARLHLGLPTWPNHEPLLAASGLQIVPYDYFDARTQTLLFDNILAAVQTAARGDVLLLHGCCHNPTGADLTPDQWSVIANAMAERGVLPLIDFAYHGLGKGLAEDAIGVRTVVGRCPTVLLAYSCDKNFGLYRDRVGALFVTAPTPERSQIATSNILALTRANWSMPPDHGAAIVRIILQSPELSDLWRQELDAMRSRLNAVRTGLALASPALAPLAKQYGLFCQLPLSRSDIARLQDDDAIYMAGSGRVNLAGLSGDAIGRFSRTIDHILNRSTEVSTHAL